MKSYQFLGKTMSVGGLAALPPGESLAGTVVGGWCDCSQSWDSVFTKGRRWFNDWCGFKLLVRNSHLIGEISTILDFVRSLL